MKKAFWSLIVLLVLGVAALLGASWYGGGRVESELQQRLASANDSLRKLSDQLQLDPPLQLKLASYERRLLDSAAVLSLEGGPAELPEDRARIDLKLTHGPLLWRPDTNTDAPLLGQGLGQLKLDLSALDRAGQERISQAFGGREPLTGLAWQGFDGQTHYQVDLNPLDYRDEASGVAVSLAEASLNGLVSASQRGGQEVLTLPSHFRAGAFRMELPGENGPSHLSFSGISADADYDLNEGGLALRSHSSLEVPKLEFMAPDLPEPVSFSLVSRSSMSDDAGSLYLDSDLKLQAVKTPFAPETEAGLNFRLSGLNEAAMTEFQQQLQELQASMNEVNRLRLAGLEQLAADTGTDGADTEAADAGDADAPPPPADPFVADEAAGLEAARAAAAESAAADGAGLSAEDRARLAELSGKLEQQQQELLDLALEKLINPGETRFTNALALSNENGKASLDMDLTYQGGPDGMALNSETLQTLSPEQLLALVKGKVDFGFDPALFPLAALFLEHPGIAREDERYVAHLELAGDKLVLNGQDMTLEEFMVLLQPDVGSALMDQGDLEDGEPVDSESVDMDSESMNAGENADAMDEDSVGEDGPAMDEDGMPEDAPAEATPVDGPAADKTGADTTPATAQ
ncbi:MAG TPA: DUF945 family protein [Thiolinea sp.]|nr:DUF945 family protein [Thiolinea sp.]